MGSPLPLPADIAAIGIQNTELFDIVCNSTNTQCTAVGRYLNNHNNVLPLSYTSVNGGSTWSLATTLGLPANVAASGIQMSGLLGVG